MRKILTILTMMLALVATQDISAQTVSWPQGKADFQTVAAADTIDISTTNRLTYVEVGQMSANAVLNASPTSDLPKGALLYVELQSDGSARDVTLGTGFEGTTVSGVINKTNVVSFIYDGSNYVITGTQQID